MNKANRDRMRSAGLTVWLTADAQTIHDRLGVDSTTPQRRPPLTVGGLAEIEQLLQAREQLYRECADMVVNTCGRQPSEIVAEIAAWINLGGQT